MLISESRQVTDLCDRLATEPYVAIDTEFIGEHSYWPRLCLIQIAAPGAAAAIDPLAPGLNLAPFFELMGQRRVCKVVHAGRQDLAMFRRLGGHLPAPVFDTQIAAMACGFGDAVAYSTLASELTGANVDKRLQVTDWTRRPLSNAQISYALADVTHLCKVYEVLSAKLATDGRVAWIEEEMDSLLADAAQDPDPAAAWQRVSVKGADGRTLAVLRELAAWRERFAARLDIPRQRVARDETLLDIAFRRPTTMSALSRSRGFSNIPGDGVAAKEILDAIARGLAVPEAQCPRPNGRFEYSDGTSVRVALLQALLKLKSEQQHVAPKLVATRSELEALILDPDGDHPALRGWRRQIFGEDAMALLNGRLAITGDPAGMKIVQVSQP
ncbi:MAG: ribonuclease D [Chloroflexi bacterium]|nr:ribonuclease D [Chloroflexota bacterium]